MLAAKDLTIAYGPADAVRGVDIDVAEGEVVVVLGPSGCGKSSLLRGIAGLEPLRHGTISFDGTDITHVPVHERGFGLMFQDYALFPHRDVAGNIGFGLRMQGHTRAEVSRRVAEVLELVGLPGFESRSVGTLSGGEQQRVALARTLAPAPRLLLLDEPLGSLDRGLRERLVSELAAIFASLGTSVIYVTHDQEEAFAIGRRIAVMRGGRVVRAGLAQEVWEHPETAFVALFLGLGPLVEATATGGRVATPWGSTISTTLDGPVGLILRPSAVRLGREAQLDGEVVEGHVVDRRLRNGRLAVGITVVGVRVEAEAVGAGPDPGETVSVSIDDAQVALVTLGDSPGAQ
ncbi:MAG: ABC transporter ATP-binding protein [Acidimicrobiales bacterium]